MNPPPIYTEAELMEIVGAGEAHAKITRGYAERADQGAHREYHSGVADGSECVTKRLRRLIASKQPQPAPPGISGREALHG